MFVLLIGCKRSPEQAAVKTANALLDEGHIKTALTLVDESLLQNPDSASLLRMRVVLLLRAGDLSAASAALQKIPAGKSITGELLRHRDHVVRANAARLIAEEPDPNDFAEIVRAAEDSDPDVRRYSAHALGLLGNTAAIKPLFRLLSDDNWFVRAEAVSALGKLGDHRAINWLVQLTSDPDGYVRYSVISALSGLAGESSHSLLRQAFQSGGPTQQFAVAVALARLRDPEALGPLTNAVEDRDTDNRKLAAQALGVCGLAPGTNALVTLLKDPDPGVRREAQASLLKITGNDAVR